MITAIENALQSQLERSLLFTPCLGINVTINDEQKGLWNGASGFIDPDTKSAMPVNSRFYIYSITKTFTAVRLLQLAESGKLSLDDPITSWLPDLPFPSTVTIRRLLNHTSGVPSYTSLNSYLPATRESPSEPWTYERVLELTCNGKLDFDPGSSWSYSNTGYMLLLKLIEVITNKRFAEAIAESIINPLGLSHTYVAEGVDKGSLVPGYCRYMNDTYVMENVIPRYHPGWCATGLIVSTTSEIVQFYQALFGGKLIEPKTLDEMLTPISIGQDGDRFFGKPSYGLGIMIDPESRYGESFGHGGDGPGYNTWAMYLPNFKGRKLTMSVFCNTSMAVHPFHLINDLLYIMENPDK
jgi:D-alanyl-D-alanine carboxypeptidase